MLWTGTLENSESSAFQCCQGYHKSAIIIEWLRAFKKWRCTRLANAEFTLNFRFYVLFNHSSKIYFKVQLQMVKI